ncbi:MAG: DNA-directed RNA polymerase subunit beta [Oscillospiraceae bacterium]|nr:DNA-directed RNA polymerase subunit beta [Oscillospiraceae bacterium]
MALVKDKYFGKTLRKSYAKYEEILEMPNLLKIQKDSYNWFLEEGLHEVFRDTDAITDYTGNLELSFLDYSMNDKPKYTVEECKERDATYARPIKVRVRLRNKETGEIKEQEIFMGDFPLMTNGGTFVINGAERVIVSQIVRSPGMYYGDEVDKADQHSYTAQIIPYRGAWLEYETDTQNVFYVRIDKNRKLPITCLIRALGVNTDAEIVEMFGDDPRITATLEKDTCHSPEDSLLEIYRRLRPGEPPTVDNARSYLEALFFDDRRYDVSKVGRYKFNKKMDIWWRLAGSELAEPIADPLTGEILAEPGKVLTRAEAHAISDRGVNEAVLLVNGKKLKVFSNHMADMSKFVDFDPRQFGVKEKIDFPTLKTLLEQAAAENWSTEEWGYAIEDHANELMPKHITPNDILASINYLICVANGVGTTDDIDHLGNRRLRCVGELLQNQFRVGFTRLERVIRERMTVQDLDTVTPQSLINIRPVTAVIKEFFGSSPLSQFMDQNNPLAELTHKRRLSALGPGGLSRERASFDVRDVHYSHYGRMCPIETPEGPNIGLINYLACFAKINEYGFVEAPFRKIEKIYDENGKYAGSRVTDQVDYMTADVEDDYRVAQANEPVDENGFLVNARVTCRHRNEIIAVDREQIDYIDVSPKMMVSVATAFIPFLQNDDANRALMGANMQRQAVPLMVTEAPIVATGVEHKCAVDSEVCLKSSGAGEVLKVSADWITIRYDDGSVVDHKLTKFARSNQGTCVNQRPIVEVGERVEAGQVIADGPACSQGEISLGKNVLIGFMTWEGYNYEDAILLNERLVREDVFTSIHIEEYETEARDTKLGPEEITRDIPNVGEDTLKDLDEDGIIRIGAEVSSGDYLVGKVTPKGETELTAEERLLRAIFGEKAREVRDSSLKVPHGESGIIVDVKKFTRANGDEMAPGVNKVVRVYIAQKRKISVGDKMAGRHGNKGVVSRVLPEEDMPFLPDGTPLDIVLNPLGVPSRMNIGQVLDVHLGYAAKTLGWKVSTPIFDGANEKDIRDTLKLAGLREDGKSILYDGRTGEQFDNLVTVGWVYFLKLHHLVDDKIHARSTGPYSLVTQQPLGGKAQFGGQRFGEMEVWALEAYGAAYTLQEILTVKSDDVTGRVKTYEAIVKGHNVPAPGVPESFKVLVKELQSLCLDIKVLDEKGDVIELKDEDEDEVVYTAEGDDYVHEEEFVTDADEVLESGYNYDEEQDEDTFTTVLQEVVAEAEAAADDYE